MYPTNIETNMQTSTHAEGNQTQSQLKGRTQYLSAGTGSILATAIAPR